MFKYEKPVPVPGATINSNYKVTTISTCLGNEELLKAEILFSSRSFEEPVSLDSESLVFYQEKFDAGQRIHILTHKSPDSHHQTEHVVGVLYSRSTGALKDTTLGTYLFEAENSSPVSIYSRFIEPLNRAHTEVTRTSNGFELEIDADGELRFHFDYYEYYLDHRTDVGAIDCSYLKHSAGFLLLVDVAEDHRRVGLSGLLVKEALNTYKGEGFRFVFAFGRLPELHKHYNDHRSAASDLQNYMVRKRSDGFHPDHGVRFHQKAGGKVICGLPYCANDKFSLYHGFMVIYDLNEL